MLQIGFTKTINGFLNNLSILSKSDEKNFQYSIF
jgi:hypothetical protein